MSKFDWNGDHLGNAKIINQWIEKGIKYSLIDVNGNRTYCIIKIIKDKLPLIVEDIKKIFNIPKRGYHIINIDLKEYICYYVPIGNNNFVLYETPINLINKNSEILDNKVFNNLVRKSFIFCDLLCLKYTGEKNIIVRKNNENFIPIIFNNKYISDEMYSIINKTIFNKWFGEKNNINDIVKKMCNCNNEKDIPSILYFIRQSIEKIIKKHDEKYMCINNIIINKLSSYLSA